MINLSKDDTMSVRLANELMERRLNKNGSNPPIAPTQEQLEAHLKMSNTLNTNELADVFQGRVTKLLEALGNDRQKAVKAKKKNNKDKSQISNVGAA